MIKVLHIGLSYELGGIEQFVINYGQNINKEIMIMDFINVFEKTKNQSFYKELLKIGEVYDIDDYRKHPFKSYKQLKKTINDGNYDIVHYNMNSAAFLLPLICAKNSNAKRVIAHAHNASNDKGIIKSVVHFINKHFITFFASDFFACSEKAAKWFFSKKVMNSNRFRIIHNAIDVQKFQYNLEIRNKYRQNLELGNNIVITHIGRFNKQKNHTKLIEIFKEIHEIENKTILLLIGDGILKEKVKNKVKDFNLTNNVRFLGIRDDVASLLQASDVFVLPSLYEGAPTVVIEAQASGLLCELSDTITKEVKILDETNYISLKKTSEDWANKILEDLKKFKRKDSIKKMTDKGYNIKEEALKIQKIYEGLVKDSEKN